MFIEAVGMDALGYSLILVALVSLIFTVEKVHELECLESFFLTGYFISFIVSWVLSIIRFKIVPCLLTILFFLGLSLVLYD